MTKKPLCVVLAVLGCTAAHAEWVAMPRATDGSLETFIDLETVRQTGPMNIMRRVWQLSLLAPGAANKALSVKSHVEYDCKDGRYRVLEVNYFTEAWGRGRQLESTVPSAVSSDWNVIDKDSLSALIFRRVCPHDGN